MTDHNALYKDAEIPRLEQLTGPRPAVSLFVLAKNAESCIHRLLTNVGPYIDEVVMVLNDTSDKTEDIVRTWCDRNTKDLILKHVTRESHPQFYILDTKATYETGSPLAGESFDGPFTEQPILSKWADVRNLLWNACTKEWRLFLDADDVVLDPECLPGLLTVLAKHHVENARTVYHFSVDENGRPKGASFRERISINKPHIRWIYDIHEVLSGTQRISHIEGNFIVRDMRDNTGKDIRIPARNFKILYHQARQANWEVSPRALVNLIMEVRYLIMGGAPMMKFAYELLRLYRTLSKWPEEISWAIAMIAELEEGFQNFEKASAMYAEALRLHAGSKTAFRLCRSKFYEKKWGECVDAYELGLKNKQTHQTLDDGPLFEDMSKILVCSALWELGSNERAKEIYGEALKAFPNSESLKAMASQYGTGR